MEPLAQAVIEFEAKLSVTDVIETDPIEPPNE